MPLSPRSIANLNDVHPVLVRIAHAAAERGPEFVVTEGRRSRERQAKLVKAGKSKTMNSRHLTGHAVDFVAIVDGEISYEEKHMRPVADAFLAAAQDLGVKITRGIDWGWDSPHIELDRKAFPDNEKTTEPTVDAVASAVTPPNPLPKSGTLWGSVVGGIAAIGAFFEPILSGVIEWGAKLSEFGPAQAALASMGGNVKSISLGLGLGSVVYVISRRCKAAQEGKPG